MNNPEIKILTREEILDWWYNDEDQGDYIYGAMHGKEDDKFIRIKVSELTKRAPEDYFVYAWGWPGPDTTVFRFEDYGRTWVIDKYSINNIQAALILDNYDVNGCGYCHQGGIEIPIAIAKAENVLKGD